jgi:epoxyqueuosine reductase
MIKPARGMKLERYPEPRYAFAYKNTPESGNTINGLGEAERRQPRKVFHSQEGAFTGLQTVFQSLSTWAEVIGVVRLLWLGRLKSGPVAPRRTEVDDPARTTDVIKAKARALGAGLVGVTLVNPDWVYEGKAISYRYAICIGVPMDREEMLYAPTPRSDLAALEAYEHGTRVAVELAAHIRALGWAAEASPGLGANEILHLPHAIAAGLGQLGKHGSLITREYGSNVRLATVVTELPLLTDHPVDLGVDDFCALCRLCVEQCPPQAIFTTKQLVRGEEKWYVDFDRCAPYFSANHSCGICVEVCPWSEPGRGSQFAAKLLARRARLGH